MHSFYDHHGNLDVGKMEALLGMRQEVGAPPLPSCSVSPLRASLFLQEQVVGWFSYRRSSSHRLSLRERVVYRQLCRALAGEASTDFALLLLTEQAENGVLSTQHSLHLWTGS